MIAKQLPAKKVKKIRMTESMMSSPIWQYQSENAGVQTEFTKEQIEEYVKCVATPCILLKTLSRLFLLTRACAV